MRKFKIEAVGMGTNNTGYPGAFPPAIQSLIQSQISGKVLHLFSGSSLIGDERVDIEHPNATLNCDVEVFVREDKRNWDFVILDPPYQITRTDAKLNGYGIKGAISANVDRRRLIKDYLQRHTKNVLWLDQCAPMIKGFRRQKLWLVLPGGFHTVRVLSWLEREMKPLV